MKGLLERMMPKDHFGGMPSGKSPMSLKRPDISAAADELARQQADDDARRKQDEEDNSCCFCGC